MENIFNFIVFFLFFAFLILKKKTKKERQKTSFNEKTFHTKNKFYNVIRGLVNIKPGIRNLESIAESVKRGYHSESFDYYDSTGNRTKFVLTKESLPHLKNLLEIGVLLSDARKLIFSNKKDVQEIARLEFMDSSFLLEQIENAVIKGIPIDHETIVKGTLELKINLKNAINNCYNSIAQNLHKEIHVSQEMRKQKEKREELLKELEEDEHPLEDIISKEIDKIDFVSNVETRGYSKVKNYH